MRSTLPHRHLSATRYFVRASRTAPSRPDASHIGLKLAHSSHAAPSLPTIGYLRITRANYTSGAREFLNYYALHTMHLQAFPLSRDDAFVLPVYYLPKY